MKKQTAAPQARKGERRARYANYEVILAVVELNPLGLIGKTPWN